MTLAPGDGRDDLEAAVRRSVTLNRETRHAWEAFAGHRGHVMGIVEALPAGGRLGVLGTGNANDIDLPRLLRRFDDVHLVDLDVEAVARGVAAQGVDLERLRVHAPVDLSGALDVLGRWSVGAADDAEVEAVLGEIRGVADLAVAGGPFDVVLSACVLTQLIDACVVAMGPAHPRVSDVVVAIRDRHLRSLVASTVDGGCAVLITDMVSSDTLPELDDVPDNRIPALAAACLAEGNFFTGTNPVAIRAAVTADPEFGPLVASVGLHPPWRWDLGLRSYVVHAVSIHRRAA